MTELVFEVLRDPRAVAGVAILVFILAGLWGAGRVWRRYRKSRTPHLEIVETKITKPAYSSNAGYLSFRIINTHGGGAEIQSIEVALAASGASSKARELQPGKVVDKHDFLARLRSDRQRFKLEVKEKPLKKTVLARAEGITYRAKLISDEYHWYRFRIIVKWRDVRDGEVRATQSRDQYIEFAVV